ncbi:uncharacterized protein LOC141649094 [Silene latifolia]|uniref:uncharacterized protein LOC141649094 n=1 Tax=Silene latifolia TaxID=37657 RepID=UPI003D779077
MAAARTKSYKLRLFISLKFITANVLDQSNGNLVQQASTIEHALKRAFDVGHTTTPKSGAIIGEVLARRVKLEAIHNHPGLERGLHVDVKKEVEKKGVDDVRANDKIVWAILHALKGNGIKIIIDQDFDFHDSTL